MGILGGAAILGGGHLSGNLLSSYCVCGVGWVLLLPCEGPQFWGDDEHQLASPT